MSAASTTYCFRHEGEPSRLDKVIVRYLSTIGRTQIDGASRSQIEQWIEEGSVTVDRRTVTKPGFRVSTGAEIQFSQPAPVPTHLEPHDFPLEILFEDEYLIVINKPPGISMHPGAGDRHATLANAVVAHVGSEQRTIGEPDRPGIVHRLDKDTTGVVVVAKSSPVHTGLAKQFAARSVGRTYQALVFSTPRAGRIISRQDQGEVIASIGRHPNDRRRMAVVESGKSATTRWKVLERFTYGTLIECSLLTGRTHQIRVHMDHIGSPVIGDRTYGTFTNLPCPLYEAANEFGRQALHAATLSFTHPITDQRLSFAAPLPAEFVSLITVFRNYR